MEEKKKIQIAKELCRTFFKDDYGNPLEISDGQAVIFNYIFLKKFPRVNINASTQYGKSTIIACALILRTRATGEQWAIVAGKKDKAKIIMEKVIQHTFDNPLLVEALEIDKNEPLERIKRERSKDKITWKGGGEIKTYSAQTRSNKNVNDALTGFGCPNVVEDESALIPDPFQTMILRMLGGHKHNCLIKVGNPFYRNHFYKSSISHKYKQVIIDYKQALKEGRYTEEFIEEARENMTKQEFAVLYECLFPEENELDQNGYYRLVGDTKLLNIQIQSEHKGELRLGVDIGEGGDETSIILRSSKYAQIKFYAKTNDLMAVVREILDIIKNYNIKPENVFIDATGIGAGVVSRLKELGKEVVGIKWASKASKDIYLNLKAENFMDMEEAFRQGLLLEPDDRWQELSIIRWKKDSGDRIKIKTKEEMRKEGIPSPNIADALALTFNKSREEEAPKVWTI